MDVSDASDSRLAQLSQWVRGDLGFDAGLIAPASADASFRRYFRVTTDEDTFIVMDAPPAKENLTPFLDVQRMLAGLGLNVPMVLARDLTRGFLLLSDLGSRQYLDQLESKAAADRLYADALGKLTVMQSADAKISRALPRYDHAFLTLEMELMPEWFLGQHLRMALEPSERELLTQMFGALAAAATSQPAAFVHRDYHSRNLLVSDEDNPGILDFQDAMWGPITYDVVSLLKDCYIAWPVADVRDWALGYREQLLSSGFDLAASPAQFCRWFDLMGLQRHIKVLGVFSRLYYRDGKSQYLRDLPRVLHYVEECASVYPETARFADFLRKRLAAPFLSAQARELK